MNPRPRNPDRFHARKWWGLRGLGMLPSMSIIQPGAKAPAFELDSHLDSKTSLSSFAGKKKVLLVFYPLDFTPT